MQAMNLLKNGLVFFAVTASTAMAGAPERSDQGIAVGPGRLNLSAAVEAAQDSNIYLSKSATGSTIIKPGAGIGYIYEARKGMIAIGYNVQMLFYSRSPEGNNAVHQTGTFDAGYEFMKDSRFTLTDRFMSTTDQASNELTARTRRNQNDAGLDVDVVTGGNWFAGLGAGHVLYQFLDKDLSKELDRTELTVAPRIGTVIGSKSKGYVKVEMGMMTYDNAKLLRDNLTWHVLAGVNGDISSRITGTAELGVFMRSYKDSPSVYEDPGMEPSANVRLTWESPPGIKVSLGLSRDPVEAVWGRFYVSTTGSLGLSKDIGEKFTVGIMGELGQDAYENIPGSVVPIRKDTIAQAGANAGYRVIKNVQVRLSDLYRKRSSADYPYFDYADNVVSCGVFAAF